MEKTTPKKRMSFIGFLLMAYFSLIACKNTQLHLYGGFIVLCGAIIIDRLFSKERTKIIFPTSCKWYYYFVIYCFFSRIWAWEPYYVSNLSKQLIAMLLLVIIPTSYFIKVKKPEDVLKALAGVGIILAIYVIIKEGGISTFYQHATTGNNRIGGGIINVNDIGMNGAVSTVILLYYGFLKKKRSCLLLSVIPFMAFAGSGSRKSILLLIVGLLVSIVLSQKNKNSMIKFLKIIAFVIVGLIVFRFIMSLDIMATINERWEGLIATLTGDSINADKSSIARKKMIEIGWQQFLKTPFLGIGLGNSTMLNGQRLGIWSYSHNDYIENLVNGGVIGFLIYYGNLLYIGIRHLKLMKIKKDSDLIISFTMYIIYLVMSAGCVTYYANLQGCLYYVLWITTIEVKKLEFIKEEVAN